MLLHDSFKKIALQRNPTYKHLINQSLFAFEINSCYSTSRIRSCFLIREIDLWSTFSQFDNHAAFLILRTKYSKCNTSCQERFMRNTLCFFEFGDLKSHLCLRLVNWLLHLKSVKTQLVTDLAELLSIFEYITVLLDARYLLHHPFYHNHYKGSKFDFRYPWQ